MMTREHQHAHDRNDAQRDHRADAQCSPKRRRAGFTLVELMVTVALSIIILGMFAALYRWTTDTYSKQKGNRRNDQRSRMLSIIIRADLQLRSFRDIVAFQPGQTSTVSTGRYEVQNRQGYFSISENDPSNNTDDVLAFVTRISANSKLRPYQGRTTYLFNPTTIDPHTGNPFPNNASGWQHYMEDNPNQPEFDDGVEQGNGVGASRAAEVVYFLRNGTLYRRVLLIRTPYDLGSPPGTGQPSEINGNYNTTNAPAGTGTFWRDFDYSAYHKGTGTNVGTKFHNAQDSLRNDQPTGSVDPDFGFPRLSLGIPPLRFGYSLNQIPARQLLPREYDTSGNFIGRFTQQETSDPNFNYPASSTSDPHANGTTINLQASGRVAPFNTTSHRKDEDVLMTNVHEFDIKVWDSRLNSFVDLGHELRTGGTTPVDGDYHRHRNRDAGIRTATTATTDWAWNRYDTWHPFRSGTTDLGPPPYKPSRPALGTTVPLGSSSERPLRAIQIRIRFYDVPTNKMRQITIVEYLGD